MWGQKAPPKRENGAKSAPKTTKWGAESAPTQNQSKEKVEAKSQNAKVGQKRHKTVK